MQNRYMKTNVLFKEVNGDSLLTVRRMYSLLFLITSGYNYSRNTRGISHETTCVGKEIEIMEMNPVTRQRKTSCIEMTYKMSIQLKYRILPRFTLAKFTFYEISRILLTRNIRKQY